MIPASLYLPHADTAYTPPDPASSAAAEIAQLQELAALLNTQIRLVHASGRVVLIAEERDWSLRTIAGVTTRTLLPQVRIDVRSSLEDATSRPEANDG